jgi:DNA polymerase
MRALIDLKKKCKSCTACELHENRTKSVFGEGYVYTQLAFVGLGPGAEENDRGRPFVGRAGKLLDRWIGAMGLSRKEVYITNVVKCWPPNNHPTDEQRRTCSKRFLWNELKAVRPKIVIALGAIAAQALLGTDEGIGKLRGKFHEVGSYQVMATYHPAFLLRSNTDQNRLRVEDDLKLVLARLREG